MPASLDDRASEVVRALFPADILRVLQRANLFLTDDGHGRADRLHGTLAAEALPGDFASDQIADEPGSGSDTVKDRFNNLIVTYAPLASPTFTGTLTAPTVAVTSSLVTVDLTTTGNAILGNGAADTVTFPGLLLLAGGGTPTPSVGAALGTGGSVGVVRAWGFDGCAEIDATAGTAGLGSGAVTTVTFSAARAGANYAPWLVPLTAAAQAAGLYVSSRAAGSFVVSCANAPTSGAQLFFAYQIVGEQ